jgi:anti-sigma factor RsiW
MSCEEIHGLLADHLDGLLDPAEKARVEVHLADCARCAADAGEMAARLEALYRIHDEPAPPADLPARIRAAARPRRNLRPAVLLRYAAVFLLGVGVAFAIRPEPRVIEVPVERIVKVRVAPENSSPSETPAPRIPRRIR